MSGMNVATTGKITRMLRSRHTFDIGILSKGMSRMRSRNIRQNESSSARWCCSTRCVGRRAVRVRLRSAQADGSEPDRSQGIIIY